MKCVCVWQIRKDFFKIKNKKVGKDLLAFGWHWLSARIERVDIVDNITTLQHSQKYFGQKYHILIRGLFSITKFQSFVEI